MARKRRIVQEIPPGAAFPGETEEEAESNAEMQSNQSEQQNRSGNFDNPGLILINIVLTGQKNYLSWSNAMIRVLTAKEKLEFILDDDDPPATNSPAYKQWHRTDCLVSSWILNTISKEVAEGFLYVESARNLWKDLKHRFGYSNGPMLFKIKRELSLFHQGNLSLMIYFNKMKRFWDELSMLRPLPHCKCGASRTCDCNAFRRLTDINEEDKLLQFLMGLDEQYDHVCNQILLMEPLPDVNQAYSMVLRIESQHDIVLDSQVEIANYSKTVTQRTDSKVKKKKEGWCDLCETEGHVRATCFKIIGYPDWWKGPKPKRGVSQGGKSNSTTSFSNNANASSPSYLVKDSAHLETFGDKDTNQSSSLTGAVSTLLEAYESKWILRNRAKLKGHDWEDVARYVSNRANCSKSPKTQTQCKNKIESMKKRYRSESAAADASSWPLYQRLDLLLRGSGGGGAVAASTSASPTVATAHPVQQPSPTHPPLIVLEPSHPPPQPVVLPLPPPPPPPAPPPVVIMTAQNSHGSNGVDRGPKEDGFGAKLSDHVSDKNAIMETDSSTPALYSSDKEKLRSKKMKTKMDQKTKKRRRREEWEIADSIRWLAEVVVRSEQARMDTMRELEKMRIEADARRGEMDLKRTEIMANTQLEIAKLFAGVGKSIDSSLRIGRN